MSSRLKKIKNREARTDTRKTSTFRMPESVTTRPRWMTLEQAEAEGPVTATEYHVTQCMVSGQTYVRRYDGRFRNLPEEQLKQVVRQMEDIVRRSGGLVGSGGGIPLWWYAEMLDNILDFDLNSPCGCPSQIAPVMGVA